MHHETVISESTMKKGSRWNVSCLALAASLTLLLSAAGYADPPVDIGGRLELMVDDCLIESMTGDAELRLNSPVPREVAIVHDAPWEGNNCCYHTVIRTDDIYRMYYRGSGLEVNGKNLNDAHPAVTCYAESPDGIHWAKPKLGLQDFGGSTENNIILAGTGAHNFCPMLDANPACPPESKFKALAGLGDGLQAFQSADGVHWALMQEAPVLTKGAFDSQNLAFWDVETNEYRACFRDFRQDGEPGRDIKTATSKDFLHWTEPAFVDYVDGRKTELYTSQVLPYYRAPHLLIGFPTRYHVGRGLLTPLNELVAGPESRCGNDYTDVGFMTSRNRQTFHVWPEAFIRPGAVMQGHWMYGFGYQALGVVETQMELPDGPLAQLLGGGNTMELSVYAREGGWVGPSCRLRRYSIRIDGFGSVSARMRGGEMVTRPVMFLGNKLAINFATSAGGSLRVELQDAAGQPIPGFSLADSPVLFGNTVRQVMNWKGVADLTALAGQVVRLRFELKDADLYSIQFAAGTQG